MPWVILPNASAERDACPLLLTGAGKGSIRSVNLSARLLTRDPSRGVEHAPPSENSTSHDFQKRPRTRRPFAPSVRVPQRQSTVSGANQTEKDAQQGRLAHDSATNRHKRRRYILPIQGYDEWIKELPDGKKVRFSCQALTIGFSASAEILEPARNWMVYTHTYTELPPPAGREQIEAAFLEDLSSR